MHRPWRGARPLLLYRTRVSRMGVFWAFASAQSARSAVARIGDLPAPPLAGGGPGAADRPAAARAYGPALLYSSALGAAGSASSRLSRLMVDRCAAGQSSQSTAPPRYGATRTDVPRWAAAEPKSREPTADDHVEVP
jgi:hypothetical protein